MLHSARHLEKYTLRTTCGDREKAGTVADVLLDDRGFVIRYLVIDTGDWLPGRKVLLAPEAVVGADWNADLLLTNVSAEQIETAPPLSSQEPVSRQHRRLLAIHYGWSASSAFHPLMLDPLGPDPVSAPLSGAELAASELPPPRGPADEHLRSLNEVKGYEIQARDGTVGKVEDFIVNTNDWTLPHVVVDTERWNPMGRRVLIPVAAVSDVSWESARVSVDLTAEEVKDSPDFDPSLPVNTAYELELFDYYGRSVS